MYYLAAMTDLLRESHRGRDIGRWLEVIFAHRDRLMALMLMTRTSHTPIRGMRMFRLRKNAVQCRAALLRSSRFYLSRKFGGSLRVRHRSR